MKKFLICLLTVIIALAALTACGDSKTPADETKAPSETTDTTAPKAELPEIIPVEQLNPRKVVLDYMYKMANLEWTPSKDIDFTTAKAVSPPAAAESKAIRIPLFIFSTIIKFIP